MAIQYLNISENKSFYHKFMKPLYCTVDKHYLLALLISKHETVYFYLFSTTTFDTTCVEDAVAIP